MKRFYRNTFSMMLLAGGLSMALDANSQSQLVKFSFTGAADPPPAPSTFAPDAGSVAPNITVSNMSMSAGIAPPSSGTLATNVFAAVSWPWATPPAPPALPNAPLDPNDYFSFTITPNSGFNLNLDSLNFKERRSGSGPRSWSFRSSLDNFATDIFVTDVPDDTQTRQRRFGLGAAYDNLSTPVEFRFYGYNAEADGGNWRLDDVELVGAVITATQSTTISFTGNALTVNENAGTANVLLSIANPNTTNASTVDVVVSGGSAAAGTDFSYTTQTVTFPAGSSANQSVTVNITDDLVAEPNETIVLSLQNASSGVVLGTSSFTITITDNDTPPPVTPLVTIASVTTNDANGVALSVGDTVRLRGISYGVNQRPTGLQFTLIDNTGGIGVFNSGSNFGYTYAEGDSMEVIGTIGQFNGLTQINITGLTHFSSGNTLQPATVVSQLSEATESELVRWANPVMVQDPADWTGSGSGFSVDVIDTNGNTFVMRIDNDVNLYSMPAPTGWFYLTGIGGQFDNASPFLEGYQLLPRSSADIELLPSVGFSSASQQVNEGAGTATVTITIANPSNSAFTVSVSPATTGSTADASDFTFATQVLTFPANSTASQTVTVNIIDDNVSEPNETIVLALHNPSMPITISPNSHTITIADNDPIAVAEMSKTDFSVYPNPTAGSVHINFGEATSSVTQVQVINSLGQVVSTFTIAAGVLAEKVEIGQLPAGLYILKVNNATVSKTGTVVKY